MTETLRGITRLSVLLVVLFSISFSIPVFLGLKIGGWGSGSSPEQTASTDQVFPESIEFRKPRSELRVTDSKELLPDAEHDAVMVSWFKLKKLPPEGQRLFLVSKLETDKSDSSGFVLAITRDKGVIRPAIFWRNSAKQGGWYTFSEVVIAPDSWFMFGLGFYEQRYLGVYIGTIVGGEFNLQLAGGYDLEKPILPDGANDLVIGPQPNNDIFRAFVGPFCMARVTGIKDELRSIFKRIVKEPSSMSEQFDSEELQFCTMDWKTDLSPLQHSIESKNFGDRPNPKR